MFVQGRGQGCLCSQPVALEGPGGEGQGLRGRWCGAWRGRIWTQKDEGEKGVGPPVCETGLT